MNHFHRMGLRACLVALLMSLLLAHPQQYVAAQNEGPTPPAPATWQDLPASVSEAASVSPVTNAAGAFRIYLPQTIGRPGASSVSSGISRAQAEQLYRTLWLAGQSATPGWTGSVPACQPGATTNTFHEAIEKRINYYRQMAGIPLIRLDTQYTEKSQAAALMMSANQSIDHTPDGSWSCFSSTGSEAAGSSNLFLGVYGPSAVDGYIRDPGDGNSVLGHRRWILFPSTAVMGSGDIPAGAQPAANALWVFDPSMWNPRPPTTMPFVAWPPAGYVPHKTVFPRWSFAVADADFSGASVTVTQNGTNIPVTRFAPVNGYGENTLVWQINGMSDWQDWPRPAGDTTYNVRVDNVRVNGEVKSYSYSVTVFPLD